MQDPTLEQEIRSLIASKGGQDPGVAAKAIVEEVIGALDSPNRLGSFYKLALDTAAAQITWESRVLICMTLDVYARVGGLTARQAQRLIDHVTPPVDAGQMEAPPPIQAKEPEPEVDSFTLALISWATLHATLQTPLASRLESIARRFAESPLPPGTLRILTPDGQELGLAAWGDINLPIAVVATAANERGSAEFSVLAPNSLPPALQQSILPLLRSLL